MFWSWHGRRPRTCGAVSAMAYLVGLKVSDANLENPKTKVDCYDTFKAMSELFANKNQSTLCSELKGMGTGVVLEAARDVWQTPQKSLKNICCRKTNNLIQKQKAETSY